MSSREEKRQAVRDAAPEFVAFIEQHFGREDVKLRALLTKDGQEFGDVPEEWREQAKRDGWKV